MMCGENKYFYKKTNAEAHTKWHHTSRVKRHPKKRKISSCKFLEFWVNGVDFQNSWHLLHLWCAAVLLPPYLKCVNTARKCMRMKMNHLGTSRQTLPTKKLATLERVLCELKAREYASWYCFFQSHFHNKFSTPRTIFESFENFKITTHNAAVYSTKRCNNSNNTMALIKHCLMLAIVALLFIVGCHSQMTPEEMANMKKPDLANDHCAQYNKSCYECASVKGCNYCQKSNGILINIFISFTIFWLYWKDLRSVLPLIMLRKHPVWSLVAVQILL